MTLRKNTEKSHTFENGGKLYGSASHDASKGLLSSTQAPLAPVAVESARVLVLCRAVAEVASLPHRNAFPLAVVAAGEDRKARAARTCTVRYRNIMFE